MDDRTPLTSTFERRSPASMRLTLVYWSLWTLAGALYWAGDLHGLTDFLWLTPVLLWLTVFRVVPVLDLPDGARTLAVGLALFALVVIVWSTYAALFDMAGAFVWDYENRATRLASMPIHTLLAALAVAILLAIPVARTLGGPGITLFGLVLLASSIAFYADSIFSWDRGQTRPLSRAFMVFDAVTMPVAFYLACRAVLAWRPSRLPPSIAAGLAHLQRCWQGDASHARTSLVYGAGILATYALLLWRAERVDWESCGVATAGMPILTWWLILLLLIAVSLPAWRLARTLSPAARLRSRAGIAVLATPILLLTLLWEAPGIGFHLGPTVRQALGSPWRLRLDDDDPTVLLVRGNVAPGLAAGLDAALDRHPAVRTLDLWSSGGWSGPAVLAAQVIRDRKLATRVTASCKSACTLLFAAGSERHLEDGAELGFHGSRSMSSLLGIDPDDPTEWVRAHVALGIDEDFLTRAVAVPFYDMWYPTRAELTAAGFVTTTADE